MIFINHSQIVRSTKSVCLIAVLLGLIACGGGGSSNSSEPTDDLVVTSTRLVSLTMSGGNLDQIFQSVMVDYTATVTFISASVTVTPIAEDTDSIITVNGIETKSGSPSQSIPLNEGQNTLVVVVSGGALPSTTYTLDITRQSASAFAQKAYVKASNTEANDGFGGTHTLLNRPGSQSRAIALYGDTLVVGAVGEDGGALGINGNENNNSATDSGAVYVFVRTGEVWSQQAYIKASNAERLDYFGFSVALYEDTLAVGAIGEDSAAVGINGDQSDNSELRSGAVYIFTRESGIWNQQAYIKASNTEGHVGNPIIGQDSLNQGDDFGFSVTLFEDSLAVGAIGEDSDSTGINGSQSSDFESNSSNQGAVYLFNREGETWGQIAYIKASNTDTGDNFGYAIALYEETLAVGSPGESSAATGINGDQVQAPASEFSSTGAVYVFVLSGSTWSQQAYVKASNPGRGDHFGKAVSLSENTLVVGAPDEGSSSTGINGAQTDGAGRSGAVYVFIRDGTSWTQQAYIKASNTRGAYHFGHSVALSDDSLAVGSIGESSASNGIDGAQDATGNTSSGAAYYFNRIDQSWAQQSYIKASNNDDGMIGSTFGRQQRFGTSVALSNNTLAVSSSGEDSGAIGIDGEQFDGSAPDSGAVYLFE